MRKIEKNEKNVKENNDEEKSDDDQNDESYIFGENKKRKCIIID